MKSNKGTIATGSQSVSNGMKRIDIQNKTKDDLNHMLRELKAKLLKLNFDLADNKVKDVSQVKKTKKDIARILTALRQVNILNS